MSFDWLRHVRQGLLSVTRSSALTRPRRRAGSVSDWSVPAEVQRLEPRVLLSVTPVGLEFQVNTFTTGAQRTFGELPQAVAVDADGDFVVAWTSNQDGSGYGVYAQRYGGGTTPTAFDIAPVINEDVPLVGGLLWAFDPETPIDQLIYTITTPAAHGTAVRTGARGFNYTPQANFNGADSFQFTVSDGQLVSPPATVSITINPINDTPTAFNIAPIINEDTPLNGGLLWASDAETPIDSLTYSITSSTAHGVVTRIGVRGFNYVPTTDFNGIDSFQFTASDGVLTSLPATVTITITVNPVPGIPEAFDATASTNEDTALNGGLMWGFDDQTPMNNLTYTITSLTAHGSVAKTGVRGFNYVPSADFHGVDSFLYTVSDGQHTSAPATMTIDVMPVNSPPTAFDLAISIDEDTSIEGGTAVGVRRGNADRQSDVRPHQPDDARHRHANRRPQLQLYAELQLHRRRLVPVHCLRRTSHVRGGGRDDHRQPFRLPASEEDPDRRAFE